MEFDFLIGYVDLMGLLHTLFFQKVMDFLG